MEILFLNWRDIKNPLKGGAEVLTHQVLTRWVKEGHRVTLFTSGFPGCKSKENIDGIEIVRAGNRFTVYLQAYLYYRKYFKRKYDVVIDQVNTIPFFTPLYVKEPLIFHVNQLAKEVWFYESSLPVAIIGYLFEPLYLRLYRRHNIVGISESTKHDLIRLGFFEDRINVVPMGIEHKVFDKPGPKEKAPTLIYVGRLKRSKRVHHVIESYKLTKDVIPEMKLWIVGDGDENYKNYLYNLAKKSRLTDVKFFEDISEEDKLKLMSRAHLIVVTSVKEGWGLIVTEANAVGTPAAGYNVSGLRDSIKDGHNGLLCRRNTPKILSENIIRLLKNNELLKKMENNALTDAKKYSWDNTARIYLETINKYLGRETIKYNDKISVIMPAYYSEKGFVSVVKNVCAILDESKNDYEIVVIYDESRDSLKEELKLVSPKIKLVLHDPSIAKEYASIIEGFEHVNGELVVFFDPNAGVKVECVRKLLSCFNNLSVDVVVGAKTHPDSRINYSLSRKLNSILYSILIKRLFGAKIRDFQTGMKVFRYKVLKDVLPRIVTKRYAYDLEILANAYRLGYKIVDAPIEIDNSHIFSGASPLFLYNALADTLGIFYRMKVLKYYDRIYPKIDNYPYVSIIIPVRNFNENLKLCLQRCEALDYPDYEIILLPDERVEWLSPRFKQIPTGHISPPEKRDVGLKNARGEIVAFIDDDVFPTKKWMKNAIRHFGDEKIAAVGGPAATPDDSPLMEMASGAVYSSRLVAWSNNYRYIPKTPREVDDYPSCNLFVRKEIMDRIGGFATKYYPGEDTVICKKITKDLDKKIIYDPDVFVYHRRRRLFKPHLGQVKNYALHRGYFVKKYPATSLKLSYFFPSFFVLWILAGWIPCIFFQPYTLFYIITLLIYLLWDLAIAVPSMNIKLCAVLFFGIIFTHFTYGIWFIKGLLINRLKDE